MEDRITIFGRITATDGMARIARAVVEADAATTQGHGFSDADDVANYARWLGADDRLSFEASTTGLLEIAEVCSDVGASYAIRHADGTLEIRDLEAFPKGIELAGDLDAISIPAAMVEIVSDARLPVGVVLGDLRRLVAGIALVREKAEYPLGGIEAPTAAPAP